MARQSPATQDEVCAGVAPTAWAAAIMIASVPAKPTSAATTAEAITEMRISEPRSRDREA